MERGCETRNPCERRGGKGLFLKGPHQRTTRGDMWLAELLFAGRCPGFQCSQRGAGSLTRGRMGVSMWQELPKLETKCIHSWTPGGPQHQQESGRWGGWVAISKEKETIAGAERVTEASRVPGTERTNSTSTPNCPHSTTSQLSKVDSSRRSP